MHYVSTLLHVAIFFSTVEKCCKTILLCMNYELNAAMNFGGEKRIDYKFDSPQIYAPISMHCIKVGTFCMNMHYAKG